jgi:hypothetical protein
VNVVAAEAQFRIAAQIAGTNALRAEVAANRNFLDKNPDIRTAAQIAWVASNWRNTIAGCLSSGGCSTPFDSSPDEDLEGSSSSVPPDLSRTSRLSSTGPEGVGATTRFGNAYSVTPLQAKDLGLSRAVLSKLQGTVINAGPVRIISVEMIEGSVPLAEVRGALPNIIEGARAAGVGVLQIDAIFANARLGSFVTKQAEQLGGIVSSMGGRDTITFILERI